MLSPKTFALSALVVITPMLAAAQPHKLLLSEIVPDGWNPETTTGDSSEWVEIFNPNDFPVSLENYYLTDTQLYWTFTTATDNLINMSASDHLVGFPTGSVVPAGGVVVVTCNATRFLTDYGFVDLAGFTALDGAPQLFETIETTTPGGGLVQRMRNFTMGLTGEAVNNFNGTNASASNGEFKVLFYWDGNSANNIVDMDIISWGGSPDISTVSNRFAPKDPGTNATGYAADNGAYNTTLAVGVLSAFYRVSTDEYLQVATGGNGFDGSDESTEVCDASNPLSAWRGFSTTSPYYQGGVINAVQRFTNADLVNPDGVTPGLTPLDVYDGEEPTSIHSWQMYN